MIKLKKITKISEHRISAECEIIDPVEHPFFLLVFDPENYDLLSQIYDDQKYYALRAMKHIDLLMQEKKELPKESIAAWY